MKKTLFIAGTHGDEPIGPALLKKLSTKKYLSKTYSSVIGNPRALLQKKRFTEADLNRVAPGESKSSVYEIRRAAELTKLFKNFDYVVDFHETKANDKIIIIISKLSRQNLAMALSFNIKEVLIWPAHGITTSGPASGPLAQNASFGIGIECGTKISFKTTLEKLNKIVIEFLKNGFLTIEKNLLLPVDEIKKKKFYLVYDKINPNEVKGIKIKDFGKVTTLKNEKFTALLFGKHQGLKGYKMRPVDIQQIIDIM